MVRIKKRVLITWTIIIAVLIISIFVLTKPKEIVSEEVAQCIGGNSVLYVQLGCHFCEKQEELFGDSYQYLNVVDCFYEEEKCLQEIAQGGSFKTPTWVIDDKKYIGVQSIKTLKDLTGC